MRTVAYAILIFIIFSIIPSQSYASYKGELRKVTHGGQVYDYQTWDAKLIWHATFFSDRFRKAFEKKHIEINRLNPVEGAQYITDQEIRQNRGWDFFITFYTKKDYKEFSLGTGTFWKIKLIAANGQVYEPIEIDEIPTSPYELTMYPHINRWSKGYRVIFPKADLGDSFTLNLYSIVGESKNVWHNP